MSELDAVLSLEVPIIVVLAERLLKVSEVTSMTPGSIVELPKNAEEELELLVNNKKIGLGQAVKVGENFGIRITYIGDLHERISAMGSGQEVPAEPDASAGVEEAFAAAAGAGTNG